MALDEDAMTHEMFENRAFRDGGAYGLHRAYAARGAHPVPVQRHDDVDVGAGLVLGGGHCRRPLADDLRRPRHAQSGLALSVLCTGFWRSLLSLGA